ncbi:MAG: T9SS type A sorting domain-containing protein [Bacteroidetes bacterium]|nr:T9SS type A sorting domain-containing protein [Bacteroidota bacterium]
MNVQLQFRKYKRKNIYACPESLNGKSIIYGSAKEKVTLQIFNLNGQILASIENLILPYCLDIENYPKGMYFVKLYNESKSDVIKMLVQ